MTAARLTAAILWAACLVPPAAIADGNTPFLSTIAIDRMPGSTGSLGSSTLSTLHVSDPVRAAMLLGQIDGLEILTVEHEAVRIRSTARPTYRRTASELDRQSSWVIDFDEASVQTMIDEFSGSPTPEQLERFVFDHIANKTYSRSFDLASRVAATGEGDCTEHAVLLAAIARAQGFPARVVFGVLVLDFDDGLFAFGHAWTEIFDDGVWQLRDATMPGDDPALRGLRYIPLGGLTDEGPSYVLALVETLAAMPLRISDVATGD